MANASRSELIARAQLLLPPRRADSVIPARSDNLEEILLRVLSEIAVDAKTNDDLRRQLTKSYSFSLNSSSYIATTDSAFADILPEAWETAELYVSGITAPASYCRDYRTFALGTPRAGIARWIVTEGRLQVRAASSALTASKACTLRDALYIPTVLEATPASNTLSENLEDEIVSRMVAAQLARLGAPAQGAA